MAPHLRHPSGNRSSSPNFDIGARCMPELLSILAPGATVRPNLRGPRMAQNSSNGAYMHFEWEGASANLTRAPRFPGGNLISLTALCDALVGQNNENFSCLFWRLKNYRNKRSDSTVMFVYGKLNLPSS